MSPKTTKPPVVILGGSSNALSIARNLGRRGIDVYLSVTRGNPACFTRFSKKLFIIEDKKNVASIWADLLLSGKNPELHGAILFPCNDDGVEFIANNRPALEEYYILDDSRAELYLDLLNKRRTLEMAEEHGIPYPKYLAIESRDDFDKINDDIRLPLIIKPQESHLFQKAFDGKKLFFVYTKDELMQRLEEIMKKDLKVILTEWLAGPDTLLSSYYTYIDKDGNKLFHFTKKVIRRFPKNNGQGCYHVTEWCEETAEVGLKFFEAMNLRGLGNIEFKRDLVDNKLKVIECNPRFTAAHELLVRCGMEIDWIIYSHLAGLPVPKIDSFKENVTLWFPRRDYLAYKELKALNELNFGDWIKSISHKQVMPHFKWSDPMPTWRPFTDSVKNRLIGS